MTTKSAVEHSSKYEEAMTFAWHMGNAHRRVGKSLNIKDYITVSGKTLDETAEMCFAGRQALAKLPEEWRQDYIANFRHGYRHDGQAGAPRFRQSGSKEGASKEKKSTIPGMPERLNTLTKVRNALRKLEKVDWSKVDPILDAIAGNRVSSGQVKALRSILKVKESTKGNS